MRLLAKRNILHPSSYVTDLWLWLYINSNNAILLNNQLNNSVGMAVMVWSVWYGCISNGNLDRIWLTIRIFEQQEHSQRGAAMWQRHGFLWQKLALSLGAILRRGQSMDSYCFLNWEAFGAHAPYSRWLGSCKWGSNCSCNWGSNWSACIQPNDVMMVHVIM